MKQDDPNVNISETLYTDLPSESKPTEAYGDVFYCTTFFLEKLYDAEVNFSPDHSAAYIETGKSLTEESSKQYDLKITADGTMTATHRTTGEVVKMDYTDLYQINDKVYDQN